MKTTIMLKADAAQRKASRKVETAEEAQDRYIAACNAVRAAMHMLAGPHASRTRSDVRPRTSCPGPGRLDLDIDKVFEQLDAIASDLVCM